MSDAATPEPVRLAALAMSEGRPVSENWLYGRQACALIGFRMIDEGTMRKYRSAAFLARKATYGEDAALAWEASQKARHEEARTERRNTQQGDAA